MFSKGAGTQSPLVVEDPRAAASGRFWWCGSLSSDGTQVVCSLQWSVGSPHAEAGMRVEVLSCA